MSAPWMKSGDLSNGNAINHNNEIKALNTKKKYSKQSRKWVHLIWKLNKGSITANLLSIWPLINISHGLVLMYMTVITQIHEKSLVPPNHPITFVDYGRVCKGSRGCLENWTTCLHPRKTQAGYSQNHDNRGKWACKHGLKKRRMPPGYPLESV